VKPRDARTSELICLRGKSGRRCGKVTLIGMGVRDRDRRHRVSEAQAEEAETVCWVVELGESRLSRAGRGWAR